MKITRKQIEVWNKKVRQWVQGKLMAGGLVTQVHPT